MKTSAPDPVVAALAALKVGLHLATAGLYGFFIDELYFLACGQHLAWGYIDFPPLTAFQAWLTRALFGDSPWSIRLFPSLWGGALVLTTAALARELGGGRFARGLAALTALAAPAFLAFATYLNMNVVEPVLVTALAWLVARMIRTGDTRLWLAFGAIAGVGLLNKHTMLLFGFALVAGLLLTPARRLLASRWLLAGGVVAFLLFLPNLLWMIRNHFPHLEHLAVVKANGRDADLSFARFWALEVKLLNPAALPVWLAGLAALLLGKEFSRFRALGLAWLVSLAVLLPTSGSHKTYYLAPAYPLLLAAGAVAIERWSEAGRARLVRPALAGAVALAGALAAPTVVPLLPPETFLRYCEVTGLSQPRLENRATNALPQFFADRFGWPEMVAAVSKAWHALPPAERERTGIFGNDFGQSGAVDFFGPRFGLPPSIGGHLANWTWGPRGYTGESLLVLGDRREVLEGKFESVTPVGEVGHPYAMRQEHFTIYLCRGPKGWKDLASIWPRLRKLG